MSQHEVTLDAVTVTKTLTEVAEIVVPEQAEYLWVSVKNDDSSVNTDQFELAIKVHSDGAYVILANSSDDFAVNDLAHWPLMYASEDPASLAAGATMQFGMFVRGLHSIRIKAAALGDASEDAPITVLYAWGIATARVK